MGTMEIIITLVFPYLCIRLIYRYSDMITMMGIIVSVHWVLVLLCFNLGFKSMGFICIIQYKESFCLFLMFMLNI